MQNRCSECIKPDCSKEQDFFCETCGGIGPFEQAIMDATPHEKADWGGLWNLPSRYLPVYIFFIRKYVATLDRSSQIAYFHYISGIPKEDTSLILGMSEQQLEGLLEIIYRDAKKYIQDIKTDENNGRFLEEEEEIYRYYDALIDESVPDEDLAYEFEEELATVKISRAFASRSIKRECSFFD
ncbi:hypothetical protein P8918_12805 [Bacillus spizizenii]|nr:hypothetical protein [Bacillus spizizenii]MCY8890449.1 hypothetical protein [Bacillus spizizenii]MEC0841904.1 hypothetical protein [Bacillus spizizenii]